jgi:sugar/nucleoside kinase (ribokinase family)
MELHPDLELCQSIIEQVRLVHFNIPNWARSLLPLARSAGKIIASDIQDAQEVDDPYRKDFILQSDYLFFSGVNFTNLEEVMRRYLQFNSHLTMICGLGAEGCAVGDVHGVRYFAPPKLDLPVIDTNGAGDSLASVFLASHIFDGFSIDESIRRGQLAARHCCSLRADSEHLVTHQDLERYEGLIQR